MKKQAATAITTVCAVGALLSSAVMATAQAPAQPAPVPPGATQAPATPGAASQAPTLLGEPFGGKVADNPEFFGAEPWPGQRVLLLLPLQLGAGWNLDKTKATRLLPALEASLQLQLQKTGKLSTTQLHRYNPIILRGVQEKLLTREQANALLAAPTLDGLQKALSPMRFEQPPLIAQVTLDEATVAVGTPSATVTTTVTGRLYEPDQAQPVREVIITSRAVPLYQTEKRKGQTVLIRRSARERLMKASDDAFEQLAQDFIRPIEDITLPDPVITAGGPTVVVPPTVIEVPKGQVLGTFETPKK